MHLNATVVYIDFGNVLRLFSVRTSSTVALVVTALLFCMISVTFGAGTTLSTLAVLHMNHQDQKHWFSCIGAQLYGFFVESGAYR
jgi:hypothetical protein